MPSGLVALLDDIAGITKLAAASLDDVTAAAGRAGSKAAGVVVDDAAVTPGYVIGLSPDRELPIIARIAIGSLKNKLLFLLPAALLLSAFAPWAITPILMLGGAYLCFEGVEKLVEKFIGHAHVEADTVDIDPKTLEDQKVAGAVRTDLILSAEIMAIALADVAENPLLTQAIILALVGIAITAGVYGVVALIVKLDDIGLHLAARGPSASRAIGRGLVRGVPVLMTALSAIGTAAMIWVGGGIISHGMETFGIAEPAHTIHHASEVAHDAAPFAAGAIGWLVSAAGAGVVGLVVGGIIVAVLHVVKRKPAH